MRKILLFIFFILASVSYGQAVTIDETFNAGNIGANSGIIDFVVQPDGKIIIIGAFSSYNGVTRNRIARLNADGTLDTSFDAGASSNLPINAIALTSDGKIIVGGAFTTFDGFSRKFIARLDSYGSVDTAFNTFIPSEPGYPAKVSAIATQQDGKIMMGGDFAIMDIANLYRLNPNGGVDGTFEPTSVHDIISLKSLDDGKVLIGQLNTLGQRIRRVNPNGEFDSTFVTDIPNSTNHLAYAFHVQPDGKIVVPGSFVGVVNDVPSRWPAVRLNNDGSTDETFEPYFVNPVYTGTSFGLLEYNNNYLLYGSFQALDSGMPNNIVLVNSEGLTDNSLSFGLGFNGVVRKMAMLPNGQILAAGSFMEYNGVQKARLARLNIGALTTDAFTANNNVTVSAKNGKINYTSATIIKSIQVYDLSGRLIHSSDAVNNTEASINLSSANQILISRITLENGAVVINKTVI